MRQPVPDTLGEIIRRGREARGLSFRQFATLVGASGSMVLRWERGDDVPAPRYLIEIARRLELRSADLFLLAGVPLPGDLPSLPAMLRAEYALPPEAIREIQGNIERVARKYARRADEAAR